MATKVQAMIGVTKLQHQLRAKLAATIRDSNVECVVGYSAAYALPVHENLTAYHAPPTQAKYLEQPSRTFRPELARIISTAVKRRATIGQAVLLAGLRLQAESQMLVPVDTGNLKASAFTKLKRT